MESGVPWWRDAVIYQVYVRSFADSDGDGIGDLPGITARLDHLADLGVDALWLTPFYTSPQHDHGYDVADPCDVDPLFGDLADFDALVTRAHGLGLRVVVDLVPNHTSSEHAWFRAALAAGPGSPERDRYHFVAADEPPNAWGSMFGGPAWTRVDDGEWYLHIFDTTQPDLNWRNSEVAAMYEGVLRFWLDRGVDGFRIDVAHGLFKAPGLPNRVDGGPDPAFDQPEVHEVYRAWRRILDSYPGDRMAVAEAWVETPEAMARYLRPDELHQAFNFHWLSAEWSAPAFRSVIATTLADLAQVGAAPTWVLGNHDVVRAPTRYGGGAVGAARARAAALTMLALPGSTYVYQGEELGLAEVDVAPEHWQDPFAVRTGVVGRDGCRVPIPWSGTTAPYGFGPGAGQPWIPQPDDWASVSVAAQTGVEGSTLELYRDALRVRRRVVRGLEDQVELLDAGEDVLAFRRGALQVMLNAGDAPIDLPPGEVLIASAPLVGGGLPADAAAWIRLP
ncbi:glycoside hydrolase family 13 protein [Nocardioides sp. AE5]|uniref:glycoside hydrolase family 13 protein n=1 Tax=Nocardioides sp. AE5 TaxID=2962573 RepID=UPI002881F84F|nr:glycoside hydrolase family 13 protein [Nocardioides sp. AE5]MDT0203122.1 glycoside hydrolase family 13 protein [Nocardioides sp. AE5]